MADRPPLRRLHPDSSLRRSSLEYWRKQPTDAIVRSLAPGERESLRVTADGLIMQGNTRVKVLEERGYNVDGLPYETYP